MKNPLTSRCWDIEEIEKKLSNRSCLGFWDILLSITMFKKFQHKEDVSGVTQLKSSVQRGIRTKIINQYPAIADYINQIMPKKDPLVVVKCKDHLEIISGANQELLFFRQRDGPYMPCLRLLHQCKECVMHNPKVHFMYLSASYPGAHGNNFDYVCKGPWEGQKEYPFMMIQQQVDRGAIRFILSGANIMCPGLTSPGAKMVPSDQNAPVAIIAEGKQHAIAIGIMKMSSEEILSKNKGIGVDNIHYLNDGLWQMKQLDR